MATKRSSKRTTQAESPALRERFLQLGGYYPWNELSAAVDRLVALLRADAASISTKTLPAGFPDKLEAQRALVEEKTSSRSVVADETKLATGGVAMAAKSAKQYLHDVRELGVAAFDSEERFDLRKLELFKRGHGHLARSPAKLTKAVQEAMARVKLGGKDLQASNDGPELLARGKAIIAELKKAGAVRAVKATALSPETVAFLVEKGRLTAMVKRASRAGVRTFRHSEPARAQQYTLASLGLGAGGGGVGKKTGGAAGGSATTTGGG
jgi:hypothetical protein